MRHLATLLHGLIGDVVLFFGKCCNSWQLATGLAICKVVNLEIIIKHFMKVMLCAYRNAFLLFLPLALFVFVTRCLASLCIS